MTRPKRSAAVAKPKTFFALFDDSAEEDEQSSEVEEVEEVEVAPRKRSRSETTTPTPTQKNHNSTGEADPTNALNAALEKMAERKMNEMREEMNALIAKQRTSNDELQRLRTELAKEKALNKKLKDGEKCDNSSIGVKKIGELDVNVFKRACEKRFPAEEAEIRGVELCSTWEQKLNGLSWNAFRMVDNKRVVNEGDASLVGLKKELGEEAYNAVGQLSRISMISTQVDALEIMRYGTSRRIERRNLRKSSAGSKAGGKSCWGRVKLSFQLSDGF